MAILLGLRKFSKAGKYSEVVSSELFDMIPVSDINYFMQHGNESRTDELFILFSYWSQRFDYRNIWVVYIGVRYATHRLSLNDLRHSEPHSIADGRRVHHSFISERS